jgi:hypothetical protein
MIDRIIKLLPVDDITKFWYDTASNDEFFCGFYKQLSTPEFIKFTDLIKEDPAFKAFLKDLRKFDIDTDVLVNWVEGFLWNRDYCN